METLYEIILVKIKVSALKKAQNPYPVHDFGIFLPL